jgi:hypothetical protein
LKGWDVNPNKPQLELCPDIIKGTGKRKREIEKNKKENPWREIFNVSHFCERLRGLKEYGNIECR